MMQQGAFGRSSFAGAMLVSGIVWHGAVAAAPSSPTETMAQVARDLGLQAKMPVPDPPEREIHFSDTHWHISGDLSTWVLVGALALALGFALYALRDALPFGSRRPRDKAGPGAIVLPNDAVVERLTAAGDDAQDLAREGLFAQAMHVLLLRSLVELRKRLDVTIADSLTSREIVERLTLPDRGRAALADLIERVERVHFGRRVAGSGDYDAARQSFETLLGIMRTPQATA